MNPKKIMLFAISISLFGVFCSKAPGPFPVLENRVVLGEFFTTDS